jgi:predicted Zn-ribbon and HTH transcriptional regulator
MPFCPKCRDEFQDWVKVCPDCGVELIDKLSPLTPKAIIPPDPIVTIATFSYPTEAHLYKTKLESEGIDAFVADEHMVQANWLYSLAIGGVRLQVKESEAEEALSILRGISTNAHEETPAAETGEDRCPKCNSTNIQYQRFSSLAIFIFWFISNLTIGTIMASPGGGFTLPFLKRKWKCHTCGYEWKPGKVTEAV